MERLHPGVHEFFGTIRDPWTWYVSLFGHAHRSVQGRAAIQRHGGTFKSFLQTMAKKGIKDEQYTLIPVRSDEPIWRDYPHGLYSHWFEIFYQPHTKIFLDTANLYAGVNELLGIEIDEKKYPPLNVGWGKKKPASAKYTQDLIDLIWETDGELAEKLGFTPFEKSTKGPVIRID